MNSAEEYEIMKKYAMNAKLITFAYLSKDKLLRILFILTNDERLFRFCYSICFFLLWGVYIIFHHSKIIEHRVTPQRIPACKFALPGLLLRGQR